MSVATWAATHAYVAGNVVNPSTANGHSYRCATGGTSGASEPTWVGRYQDITDGTVTWVPYSIITPSQVRSQLHLEPEASAATTPVASGQYADSVIGPYILDAIASLEQATSRYLVNQPGATKSWTSQLAATLPLPGLRTATSVTYAGATQTANAGYYLLPDAMQTGVYTTIQFRPFRVKDGGPWWLALGGAITNWFDTGADSPYDPRNYGGGFVSTSTPLDTVIVGDWGYEPGFEPGNVVHAVEILSEWYVMRPPAILADSAITAQGGIVSYSQMPPEVQEFVKSFRVGRQVVSVD